ncbi:CAP domain-containing protein [Streptomyces sp. AF1A]|uniref:CAP domain-containing protein n=1 Tax=Streptomyces sp. AF1A TaxID=3394350 RepID=UPI0039BC2273
MGRHRRSAAGRATTGHATEVTHSYDPAAGADDFPYSAPEYSSSGYSGYSSSGYSSRGRQAPRGIAPYLNPEAYAEANARAHSYLFTPDDDTGGFSPDDGPSHGNRHRKKAAAKPVRTGLLGVSAAVALGTAAVATGMVPGLQNYRFGGSTQTTGGDQVQAAGSPTNAAGEQGGTSGSVDGRTGGGTTSRDTQRSPSPGSPSASPSDSPTAPPAKAAPPNSAPSKTAAPSKPETTPSQHAAPKAPSATSAPVTTSAQAAAEAEVLKLVNEERAKVGCSALTASPSLAKLAGSFSDDMAARGFFDHTDPDGKTPWDRAAAAGIANLGGENIARGQADAAAVMDAWMNSPGHRANILNCDFKTLGVGVHLGTGGPWWTQDFGY